MVQDAPMRDPAIAEVAAEVRRHLADVLDAMYQAVLDEVPAYHAATPKQLNGLRQVMKAGLDLTLDLWPDERKVPHADLAWFREAGFQTAIDGFPLPAALRGFRVATDAGFAFILARHLHRLTAPQVARLARLSMEVLDQLPEGYAGGYADAADNVNQHRELAIGDFIEDLLAGRFSSREAIAARTRNFGVTLPDPIHVLAVRRSDNATLPGELFGTLRADLTELQTSASVFGTARRNQFVFLIGSFGAAEVSALIGRHDLVAAALRPDGRDNIPTALDLAVTALDTAPPDAWCDRALLPDPDVRLIAMLAGKAILDGAALTRELLGTLTDSGHEHLLATLTAYLEAGNAVAAAERCHVHAQTLRYRLRRIAKLTGRDLDQGWHRFALYTAVRAAAIGPNP